VDIDWGRIWTPTWPPAEVAVRALLVYLAVFGLFRLIGRKELLRYSNFDIALLTLISAAGRQTIVGNDTSFTSALIGLGTIFSLDWLLSVLVVRNKRAANAIEGPSLILVRDGVPDEPALRRARLSRDELLARLREHATESLEDVERATFEHSGRVTFVLRSRAR
jgi:uncharacterized membrane protein YcaP (DUF421 family)